MEGALAKSGSEAPAYWGQSRELEVAIQLNVPTDLGAKSPRTVIKVQSFGHFMGKKSMLINPKRSDNFG